MQRGVTTRTAAGPDQARLSLALWLRQGRAQRGMSVEDVAKVTKIQPRILESLEAGKFERLPADVFVRGFVRSIARCVGLDADEALARFVAASNAAGVPTGTAPVARALLETMSELAPATAKAAPELLVSASVVEVEVEVEVEVGDAAIEVVDASRPAAIEVVEVEAEVQPIMTAEGSGAATIAALSAASDLEIDIVVAEPVADTEAPKRKRTRKAKGTDAPPSAAPRTRRKKQPTEATEVVVAAPADGGEVPAPKRRRKKQTTVSATVVAAPSDAAPSESTELPSAESSTEFAATSETTTAEPRTTIVIDASSAVSDLWAPRDHLIEPEPALDAAVADTADTADTTDTTDTTAGTWSPRMPVATPSAPWRRRHFATTAPAAVSPVLTIDDSDPESAEREREDRSSSRPRRSFLPPILLDRDDRGARQGGLTLAVIILLIAATLTLSYLMRRPSSSGDGVTLREIPTRVG
jgi:hypothetical protein